MMLFWLIFMMCSLFLSLFKNGLFGFVLLLGQPGSLPSTSSLHYLPLLRCLPDWQCTSASLLAQKTRADREREHHSSQEGWVSKHHRCKRLGESRLRSERVTWMHERELKGSCVLENVKQNKKTEFLWRSQRTTVMVPASENFKSHRYRISTPWSTKLPSKRKVQFDAINYSFVPP